MGLPYSTERIMGWRSQYEAMLRWLTRCEACHKDGRYTSRYDALDFILAFFVCCYHLCDYAIETGRITKADMRDLVQNNLYMRLCRDVCIRTKHYDIKLSKPLADKDWSIGREYNPWPGGTHGETLFLIADDKFDAMTVVRECAAFWKAIVDSGRLHEPADPFAS